MDPWLVQAARRRPERPALVTPSGQLTYAELEIRARAVAGALRVRGVMPGDRVGVALSAPGEFAVTLHACLLLGATAVPIDLRLRSGERARRGRGLVTVVDGPLEGTPLRDPMRVSLERVATLMHTSGTTVAPRPIELTCGNWLANATGSAVALGLDRDERWLCSMPLSHVGGLSILIRSLIYMTTAVLHERFDAEAVSDEISDPERGITLVSLVPTMLGRLLDAGLAAPPCLRWALVGGAPCPPALLERARDAHVPVLSTYGMTEACSQIATDGWPLPGVDVRLAPDGEVLVRGPIVAPSALGPDGWLHTGDLGRFDDAGRLRITGRKADTILTGGENVAPAEVEAVLLSHPAVLDAAVHARPDADWGEMIVATVVLRAEVSVEAEELRRHCRADLADFKVPKSIEFAPRLPRTETGKLLRGQLV